MTAEAADNYYGLPGIHLTGDQIVAINMRYWRDAAEITQEELGKLVGWSKANVSALERSADPKNEVRRFNAEMVIALANALDVPITAFFLPPPDDGITQRYLSDAGAGTCLDMNDLAVMTLATPGDGDLPASRAYRDRYAEVIDRYFDPDRGEQLAAASGDLGTAELRALRIERLRWQRGAIASLITDLDQTIDAIADLGSTS
jgi:transcriptional regulator with XRE-family HTH domain